MRAPLLPGGRLEAIIRSAQLEILVWSKTEKLQNAASIHWGLLPKGVAQSNRSALRRRISIANKKRIWYVSSYHAIAEKNRPFKDPRTARHTVHTVRLYSTVGGSDTPGRNAVEVSEVRGRV